MKQLVIKPQLCIACHNCELACSFKHYGEFRKDKARVRVIENINIKVPILCLQCEDAACVKVCPSKALYLSEEKKTVEINENRCIKCLICVSACPFGNITVNPDDKSIQKCNLCNGQPICAIFCPTKAIEYK